MLFEDVDTSNFYFKSWFYLVPISYLFLVCLFRSLGLFDFKTWKGSRASDILAFELIAGFSVTYLGVWGLICKFNLLDLEDLRQISTSSDFYARSTTIENHIIYPMMVFQSWNVLLCFVCRDLRDPAMIAHHIITAMCSSFALHPCMQYYSISTLGLTELSGIPLTVIDIFKFFPHWAEKYPNVNITARISFAILFYSLRIIYLPFFMIPLTFNTYSLLVQGKAHNNGVFIFVLVASIFMVGLQFLWAYKIALLIRKMLYPDTAQKKKSK